MLRNMRGQSRMAKLRRSPSGRSHWRNHEAAEREARQLIETRLRDGCAIPEISELEENRGEAISIQIWGEDLVAEAEGWEEIVVDLLIFKAKQKKAAA
jgi:hypothetical protein